MDSAAGTATDGARRYAIRPATVADSAFIEQLMPRFAESGALPWRDPELMRAFHEDGIARILAQLRSPGSGHAIFLAIDGARHPLGFIYLHDERSALTGEMQGYVSMLAVAVEAEGRGVGRALLAAGERWTRERGYRHLTLDTFGDNTRSRAFYRHLDYAEESLKLVKVV